MAKAVKESKEEEAAGDGIGLKRELGLFSAISMIVAVMIGECPFVYLLHTHASMSIPRCGLYMYILYIIKSGSF